MTKADLVEGLSSKLGVVCNAIKLSQFTGVKMSHPGLVVSSLFAEILTV